MTSIVGVKATFEECLQLAWIAEIDDLKIPVLNIRQLIANKKAVGREKDQLDAMNLERILQQRENDR